MYKLDNKMENKVYGKKRPQPINKNIQRNSICTFYGKVKKKYNSAFMHRNINIYKYIVVQGTSNLWLRSRN